ncbi:MAG: hypothetical protein ABI537_05115 [Casimicrobiaceae bacterium]
MQITTARRFGDAPERPGFGAVAVVRPVAPWNRRPTSDNRYSILLLRRLFVSLR